jgi:hypothetical protein
MSPQQNSRSISPLSPRVAHVASLLATTRRHVPGTPTPFESMKVPSPSWPWLLRPRHSSAPATVIVLGADASELRAKLLAVIDDVIGAQP